MAKVGTAKRETHTAEKQITAWLPPKFVDEVNGYIKMRQAKSPVARQTTRMLLYDALREFIDRHPEG